VGKKTSEPGDAGRMMKVQYVLEARHVHELRAEALKRAAERGAGKPDASEVLRDILDAWLKRRSK
jgi:hypothetical protein